MIKPNELRIGDVATKWVKTPNGIEHQVRAPYNLTIDDLVECSKGLAIFKGVELTEEILLKCGFVEMNNNGQNHYKNMSSPHLALFPDEDSNNSYLLFYYWGGQETNLTDSCITSLHQLQNIYFALTGEELNVEL